MRILSSDVAMQAQTTSQFEHTSTVERTWQNPVQTTAQNNTQNSVDNADTSFKTLFFNPVEHTHESEIDAKDIDSVFFSVSQTEQDLSVQDLLNKFIIEVLLARFLGQEDKKVKLHPNDHCCCKCQEVEVSQNNAQREPARVPPPPPRVNFGSEETTHEFHKKNAIDFGAKATIKTADKDIDVDLNLSYTQEFYEKYKENVDFQELAALDPLIIHYDLSSNYFDSISDEINFEFDINNDGEDNIIPVLKDGSGFLALDKNSNGEIDNGSELFGPQTNNGFEELKEYDEDGNDWIDENDSIFNDLRIWTKNESGEDNLIALADANVGAIYLSDVESQFDYDKSANENLAHLKSTSIFLTEDGNAGLVTGVDFTVS